MFDLESEIKQWRAELARTGLSSGEVVDELESHLREDFRRQVSAGETEERAFQFWFRASEIRPRFKLNSKKSAIRSSGRSGSVLSYGWRC